MMFSEPEFSALGQVTVESLEITINLINRLLQWFLFLFALDQ